MIDLFAPSLADDERLRRAWARYERQAASPGQHDRDRPPDLRERRPDVLPAIRVPTLVIHRAEARGFGVEHGRYLAEHIPGAKYVELPGTDNLIWAGDQDAILAEIQDFVTGVRPAPTPHRVLATVLFTDIVGSTRLAAELGDGRWQALLDEHYRVARRQLERSAAARSRPSATGPRDVRRPGAGDPLRGRRSATRVARARPRDPRRPAHRRDRGPAGRHRRASPSTSAPGSRRSPAGGEILVSSTVKDLVVGSGLVFEDRGTHALKGVPGEWRVFAVRG